MVLYSLAGVALAAPRKLRVNDPALANAIVAHGGTLIADYGGFQIIEADDAVLTNLDARHAERQDDFDEIKLNTGILNTRSAEVRALRKSAGDFSGGHLHLIQFAGPVKPEWRAMLERTGARIVSYIPENAYLIYGDAAALGRMQSWAGTNQFVQWEGAYANDYKIYPDARLIPQGGTNGTPPQQAGPMTDTFSIQLVDDPADPQSGLATFTEIGRWQLAGVVNQYSLLGYLNVIVRLPPEHLAEIAAHPDVVSIQPYFTPHKLDERQDQIVAGNLSGNLPSGPGYLAWLAGKGFTQAQFTNSGFIVDVTDSGIDNGTNKPGHFGLYRLGDTSQVSRVAYNKLQGTPNFGSTLAGTDGHGTLNAHIVAGYDNYANAFPHTDSAGYYYGLGVCPFVKVGSSVIFDPSTFTNPNYTNLMTYAYTNGVRISNNSWGDENGTGIYDSKSQAYDALVRDVGAAGQNRQMVVVFAAGNKGAKAKTISSPGSAKNVFTVGASENVRSMTPANGGNDPYGYDGCASGYSDTDADNANDMSVLSSRGPCADGRMKPDIVAPGTHITGGVAQTNPPPSPAGLGLAIPNFTSSRICALIGSGDGGQYEQFFPARPAVFHRVVRHEPFDARRFRRVRAAAAVLHQRQQRPAQPGDDQGVFDECRALHDRRLRQRQFVVGGTRHGRIEPRRGV